MVVGPVVRGPSIDIPCAQWKARIPGHVCAPHVAQEALQLAMAPEDAEGSRGI